MADGESEPKSAEQARQPILPPGALVVLPRDLPYVIVWPHGKVYHRLDPQRPGYARCGVAINPWRAAFAAQPPTHGFGIGFVGTRLITRCARCEPPIPDD